MIVHLRISSCDRYVLHQLKAVGGMCVSLELKIADPLVLVRLPACSSCRLILLCLVHTLNDRPNVPVDFISPATSKVSRLLSVINFVKEEEGRSQKERMESGDPKCSSELYG